MNIIARTLVVAVAAFCSSQALAAPNYHTSRLKFVYPLGDGATLILGFTDNSSGCPSTQSPTKYMYVTVGQNGVTADGLKSMMAAALVAYTTGGVLSIAFDDATSYCYINRVSLSEQ